VTWTFVVDNVGTEPLTEVAVTDDGVRVPCPKTNLEPQESMTCILRGTALGCEQHDIGRVVAYGPGLLEVSDEDHTYYTGREHQASLDLEMRIDGQNADEAPWPLIRVGQPIQWSAVITNTGDSEVLYISVSNDQGLPPYYSCPKYSLQPRESMTCTAASLAQAGMHHHLATVLGMPSCGGYQVSQTDPASYIGQIMEAAIDLEHLVDGQDADEPSGPTVKLGAPLTWTFVVANTGDLPLTGVTVKEDSQGYTMPCPKTDLAVGESMTFTVPAKAYLACDQPIFFTVSATIAGGGTVSDKDVSWYFGLPSPAISLEMRIEGQDSDAPPGELLWNGTTAHWTYVVTNTGDIVIFDLKVTDDHLGVVTCPQNLLNWGETVTCTASSPIVAGQYSGIASAKGISLCKYIRQNPVPDVSVTDPAYYFGITPVISLETLTNGEYADNAPGPIIPVGSPVLWTYVVTNLGDTMLISVGVTDDQGVIVTCPKTSLMSGESMACTASGTAVAGQYANIGIARGTPAVGPDVTASNPSHYFGVQTANSPWHKWVVG
jgi:hypothetical protein